MSRLDVYDNGNNGSFRGGRRRGNKLTPHPVNRTYFWEGQEIFVPAVYTGRTGAVLDVCVKIPSEDMTAFLQKWHKELRLSLKTQEEYEQMEADNPSCIDFGIEMCFDGEALMQSMRSTINWYPEEIFAAGNEDGKEARSAGEWENDREAEQILDAYGCSRECCWHFARLSYRWKEKPLLSPQRISLLFQDGMRDVTAAHFTTGRPSLAAFGQSTDRPDQSIESYPSEIRIVHPATGQEHTLTLYACEQEKHDLSDIGAKGMVYPEYSRMLTYTIAPAIDRGLFDIRDCAQGDSPRPAGSRAKSGQSGAVAVFAAGRSAVPGKRAAASSMHFEPVESVRWRIVFRIKQKTDMQVDFLLAEGKDQREKNQ